MTFLEQKKNKFAKEAYAIDGENDEDDLHPPVSGCFRDLEFLSYYIS